MAEGTGRDAQTDASRDGSGQRSKAKMAYESPLLRGPDTIAEEEAQGGFLRKDRPEGGTPEPNFTPGNRGGGH